MSCAKSVAKELVRLSHSGRVPDPLTPYRLHILVYYAQAWSLVLRDSELFPDEITCQEDGPVVPAIADALDRGLACPVVSPTSFSDEPKLDDVDEAVFLRHLWQAYGDLSPSGLFAAAREDAPFLKAKREREAGGKGQIDMNELAESFGRRPGLPEPLHQYRCRRQEQERVAELAILSSPPLDVNAIWKSSKSITPSAGQR